jgi:hypothetical protein
MRACEGCRRRKIKCDAATTNSWPCGACVRLKLTCVRPNTYDGAPDSTYDPSMSQPDQYEQMQVPHQVMSADPRSGPSMYAQSHGVFHDNNAAAYSNVAYDGTHAHPTNMPYGSIPQQLPVMDPHYTSQTVFPTPPPLQTGAHQEPSPEAFTPESFQQQDLADLLGNLKVDEKGTGMMCLNTDLLQIVV